ncbi:MAG: hypothetical protein ACR2K2_09450 [Mycobacteriales bacterium]
MDTVPPSTVPPSTVPPRTAAPGPPTPPGPAPSGSLGAELRESLLLLSFASTVTVGLTAAAQAALALLS